MTKIQNILKLSSKYKRKFFDSFDLIFFDCDGVIWRPVGSIPNAGETINLLKDTGKKCKFVSNNSVRSEVEYLEIFKKIGVRDVVGDDIIHPVKSMERYIKTHYSDDAHFFSICSNTANNYLQENGIRLETMEIIEKLNTASFVERVRLRGKRVQAVLFDINLNLNYAQLARAAEYLQKGDCDLIAGASEDYLLFASDLTAIGFSYFEQLLGKQNKQKTIILGKPGDELVDTLKDMYQIKDPKRVLLIGDSLKEDISFGKKAGFQTLLVLTGKTSMTDMLAASEEFQSDYYADKLADFEILLKDIKETSK